MDRQKSNPAPTRADRLNEIHGVIYREAFASLESTCSEISVTRSVATTPPGSAPRWIVAVTTSSGRQLVREHRDLTTALSNVVHEILRPTWQEQILDKENDVESRL